jgi:hypothetical protein
MTNLLTGLGVDPKQPFSFLALVPVIVALEKVNLHDPKTLTNVLMAFPDDFRNGLITQAFTDAHINVPAFLGTLPPAVKLQVIQWANSQQTTLTQNMQQAADAPIRPAMPASPPPPPLAPGTAFLSGTGTNPDSTAPLNAPGGLP